MSLIVQNIGENQKNSFLSVSISRKQQKDILIRLFHLVVDLWVVLVKYYINNNYALQLVYIRHFTYRFCLLQAKNLLL